MTMIHLSIDLSLYLILIYIILDSANILLNIGQYKKGQILHLYAIDTVFVQLKFLNQKAVVFLIGHRLYRAVLWIRLLLSVCIVAGLMPLVAVGAILLVQIFIHIRNEALLNLADKFAINILLGLTFIYLFPDSLVIRNASILFIALLTVIGYFFTAFFKLQGETWKGGTALEQILSTDIYGNEWYFKFLIRYRVISRLLNYSVIGLQLVAPLALVSSKFALFYCIAGLVFHLSISLIMNLNNFFWVFVSAYPCLYFASLLIENYLHK